MAIQHIDIADKTTLDATKATVEARGGIKYNATTSKPQVYDTTNSAWVDLEVGGGAKITIVNENNTYTNQVFTITHETGLFSDTATLTGSSVSIPVPYLGRYFISWQNASSQTLQQSITITGTGNIIFIPLTITEVSPFATISDTELLTALEAHYYDKINLANYWAVGDTRKISLASMNAPAGSSGTWTAQNIIITIVDFDHTDLATAINGHTKSAITVQTRELLSSSNGVSGGIYIDGSPSYDTSFTPWKDLYIRTYLNNTVYNAFPNNLKSIIKPSTHYRHTTYNGTESEQVTDNLFLPSYPEIFGAVSYKNYVATSPAEGTQFKYYQNSSNRIKYPNNNGNPGGSADIWCTGSTSSFYNSERGYNWCYVIGSGIIDYTNGSNARGVAPVFAI